MKEKTIVVSSDYIELVKNEMMLIELCLNSAYMHLEELQTFVEFMKNEPEEAKKPKPENNPESD
jgi:hypothetical protein